MPPTKKKKQQKERIELVPGGKNVNGVFEPRVSAADLVSPPPVPKFTEPRQPTINENALRRASNVATEVDGIITANTAEAQRLKELREEQASFGFNGAEMFDKRLEEGGVNANLSELKDINLQLTDMQTASDLRKKRIAGAEGQTLNQGLREVTQEDQEEAVRQTGLAARAAVLTDNINTATALAKDAVNLAFQDAELELSNRIAQIEDLGGVVDDQTQQLVDRMKEVKGAVQSAILAGASQAEISTMLSSETPDDQKFAIAQSVIGRTAQEDRALDRAAKNASITASTLSARKSLLELALAGDQQSIDQLGYDPNQVTDPLEYETESAAIADNISRAEELIGNSLGIKSSAGAFQPDAVGGFFAGSAGITQADGVLKNMAKFVPIIGNIIGSAETVSQKGDFLAGVSYIVNNNTFDKLTQLKEDGATFGSLSDSERIAIGRAASDLAASIVTDEVGNITGFKGSEKKLAENLEKVMRGYEAAQDDLNIRHGITAEEQAEAARVWNE